MSKTLTSHVDNYLTAHTQVWVDRYLGIRQKTKKRNGGIMNKSLFKNQLLELTNKCIDNYYNVELEQKDTSEMRHVGYLTYKLFSRNRKNGIKTNWNIDIDYRQVNDDNKLLPSKDRSLGVYFSTKNDKGDSVYKTVNVYYNEYKDCYDMCVMVSVNSSWVAEYRKQVDYNFIAQNLFDTLFRNK